MLPSRAKKTILLNVSNYFSVLSSVRQKSHYDTLGVTPKATQSEIKAAFYRLSKAFHPDTNKDPKAADRFREVVSAYEVLGSSTAKRLYDRGQNQPSKAPTRKGFKVYEPEDIDRAFRQSSNDINRSLFSKQDRVYNFKAWTDAHYAEASYERSHRSYGEKIAENRRAREKDTGSVDSAFFQGLAIIGVFTAGILIFDTLSEKTKA